MNVKKCANGHFFDADKYQLCPHCGVAVEDDIPKNTAKEKKHHALSRKRREDQQDVVMKQMPQKTMGKTFGVFDEETKAEIKRSVIMSDPKPREEKGACCQINPGMSVLRERDLGDSAFLQILRYSDQATGAYRESRTGIGTGAAERGADTRRIYLRDGA